MENQGVHLMKFKISAESSNLELYNNSYEGFIFLSEDNILYTVFWEENVVFIRVL